MVHYRRDEYRRCGYCLAYWVPGSKPLHTTRRNPFPAAVMGIVNGKNDYGDVKPFFRTVFVETCPACGMPGADAAHRRMLESGRREDAEHEKELAEQDILEDLGLLT